MAKKKTLSPRQEQLVEAVRRLTAQRGFSPSLAELARELGCSLCRAKSLADTAKARGFLLYEPRVARSYRVVERSIDEPKGE